jgi:hypothetical protein
MSRPKHSHWPLCLLIALASAAAVMIPAYAEDESAAGTDVSPPDKAAPPVRMRDPAATLAKRLDLDAKQTAEVRRLLVTRHAQIQAVWTDGAIDAGDRVGAVKAINDKTEAQIRAILTEEQRKKYFLPKPSGKPAPGSQSTVADWLNVRSRANSSSPTAAPGPTK